MQEPLTDEVVDLTAGLERGVQLERRVGPQQALVEITLDVLPDPLVLDRQERLGVVPVVIDQLVPQRKYIHPLVLLHGFAS